MAKPRWVQRPSRSISRERGSFFVLMSTKPPLPAFVLHYLFGCFRFPRWSFVSIDPLLGDGVHIEKQRKIRSAHNLTLFSGAFHSL